MAGTVSGKYDIKVNSGTLLTRLYEVVSYMQHSTYHRHQVAPVESLL